MCRNVSVWPIMHKWILYALCVWGLPVKRPMPEAISSTRALRKEGSMDNTSGRSSRSSLEAFLSSIIFSMLDPLLPACSFQ